MHFHASLVVPLILAVICQVSGLEPVTGLYGETVEVPCNNGAADANAFMTKWKYEKLGAGGDLLVKKEGANATVMATDSYKDRVSMGPKYELLISAATLDDQNIFTCMVVAGLDIQEYPVQVVIHKAPSGVEMSDKVQELEIGKLTKLAQCTAKDAHPAANITWFKNEKPLVSDGKGVVITASVAVDSTTGLSSTSSTLQYAAGREDMGASFTCGSEHTVGNLLTVAQTFIVTYPTEEVRLEVASEGPVTEGDNITLKCTADGNPKPTSFNFYIKGEVVKVENSDTYVLHGVTRDNTGEYKCSLINDTSLMGSANITVNYLDMTLSPSGTVTETVGGSVVLALKTHASGEPKVAWTKDNKKLDKQPKFETLSYSHTGVYEVEVTMGTLVQKASFELVVEGVPVVTALTKQRGEDGQHKVLVCEAQGFPKPSVTWSINGTSPEESPFVGGRISYKLTIVPTVNLTVFCTVSNYLGTDTSEIYVNSLVEKERVDTQGTDTAEEGDQTKLVVGIVLGLLLATVIVGMAYWFYTKKSKQGSWKTNEKEDGSSEESKKLEEKVEESSQKAEV